MGAETEVVAMIEVAVTIVAEMTGAVMIAVMVVRPEGAMEAISK